MYLEAIETARLYQLLSNKLGNDTAEAIFKYIDNKTERSVEASIKTLATKQDLVDMNTNMHKGFAERVKWMFIFGIAKVGVTVGIVMLFLKK